MRNINAYKHLNVDDTIPFSIPETAKLVNSLNYGAQRFLSELVEIRESSKEYELYESYRIHTQQLRELLESGWY